jgi:hypothetical protein
METSTGGKEGSRLSEHSWVWDWAKANGVPDTTPAWFDVEVIGDRIRVETWVLNETGGVIFGARNPVVGLTHMIELPLLVAPPEGMIEAYQRSRTEQLVRETLGDARLVEVARAVVLGYQHAVRDNRSITLWELLEDAGIPPVWKALAADGSDHAHPDVSNHVDADTPDSD